ncbi:MAG: hypothetical protein J2P37_02340 [Ktedonobacteraceae bacterium]|nr:hypothetical protein [Ktedonobacteraceae bacterium]
MSKKHNNSHSNQTGDSGPQQCLTDFSNADGFLSLHGSRLKFVPGWGWLLWDGRRWQPNATSQVISLARYTIITHFHNEATALPTSQSGHARRLTSHAQNSTSLARLRAMLDIASQHPNIRARPDDFDRDPFLLNVENGTLDLHAGFLSPHDPANLITRCVPIAYDPKARSSAWNSFVDACTDHQSDLRDYLQAAIGYSLTGSTQQNAFFLMYGPGRNGKTTFMEALAAVLGDYVLRLPIATFLRSRSPSDLRFRASTLTGRRLLLLTETTDEHQLNLSMLKRLTSGEPIFLPPGQPGEPPQPFHPTCKLWLATNHLPRIPEQTPAIWQRLKLIPFTVSFEGREDHTLARQFQKDAPAILAWAVQGCANWQKHGLSEPDRVTRAITDYRDEQDELADFFAECFDYGADRTTPARAVHRAHCVWASRAHRRPLTENALGRQLVARGFQRERTRDNKFYKGLALRPEYASPELDTGSKTAQPATNSNHPNRAQPTSQPNTAQLDYGLPPGITFVELPGYKPFSVPRPRNSQESDRS